MMGGRQLENNGLSTPFFCKATCQAIVQYQSLSSLASIYLSLFPKIAPSESNLRVPTTSLNGASH